MAMAVNKAVVDASIEIGSDDFVFVVDAVGKGATSGQRIVERDVRKVGHVPPLLANKRPLFIQDPRNSSDSANNYLNFSDL
jgi:hypothetical protein